MATKNQIRYGSKGNDVKELQTALNKSGYNLSVDGVFGSKTQAAVKDYQNKNNLQVDGIVGTKTWGSLFPTSSASASATETKSNKTTTSTPQTTILQKTASQKALESVPKFQYDAYQESDLVAQAKAALQEQLNKKPNAYQSPYQQQINDTLDKILNREKFSYDLNGDALYQQYKDQYVTQGQQAMMDTMGQAAALTGGYGNSYAQSVGQQTYQGYLQQLNDKIPELYQLALDQYNREGDDLYNQYSLYTDRENTEYNRYRDDVSDYYTNLDYLTNQYQNERDFDYGKYTDDRNLAYQTNRDQVSDAMWQTEFDEALRQYDESFAYQKDRDKVSDEQWQKTFDESVRQFNAANGGSSSSSGSSSSKKTSKSTKNKAEDTKNYADDWGILSTDNATVALKYSSQVNLNNPTSVKNYAASMYEAGLIKADQIDDVVNNALNKNWSLRSK